MLHTERLTLRRPLENDLEQFHNLHQDEDIKKYLCDSPCMETSKRFLDKAIAEYDKNDYGLFLICEKGEGQVLGYCKIKPSTIESSGVFEISYGILSKYRRKGYATETISKVLSWAFEETNAKRILAQVKSGNTGSLMTLKKLDFKQGDDRIDPNSKEADHVFFVDKPEVYEDE